jgi:hypothetical protein
MRWVCKVVKATPWHFSFWLRILAGGGAAIFGVLGTWNPTSSELTSRNFFLGSSICWFALSCYYVCEVYKSKAASFDQEEENRFLLNESILDDTTEDKETREEICRASNILARVKDKDHAGPIVEPQLGKTSSSSLTAALKKHLAFFSESAILDLTKNREESSSQGRGEVPHLSQVDEEEEKTSSETESHEQDLPPPHNVCAVSNITLPSACIFPARTA